MSGRFISFEGGEGSGKSTQLRRAAIWLEARGVSVVQTREPGGASSAEIIRDLLVAGETDRWTPITEVLLHAAARTEHLAKTVHPALDDGQWVLTDRFADSTLAYQGYGHGVDKGVIRTVHAGTTDGFQPALTLILDVTVETGLARARGRRDDEDRYERMGDDFHRRVRQGFLDIAADDPARCRVIDAAADEDTVHRAVVEALETLLEAGP